MSNDARGLGDAGDGDHDLPDELRRPPAVRAALARWKHAVVVLVVAATAWVLYGVAGRWTLDATVFAVAAVGIVAYSLLTLRTDLE